MKKYLFLFIFLFNIISAFSQPIGWNHSRTISITENSGTNVFNYQLRIIFDSQSLISAGQMNSDGSDLRFGTLCDVSNLNYWIESGINTPTTVVWIKIDTLLANQTRDIFMFYGNTSAFSSSTVNGTFFGPHSSTDSLASGGSGGAFNSQRGFRFSPNVDILVTSFGKREPNGTTRFVTLFDFVSQAILAQIQVSGPAAQYSYAPISNPMWLTQGTQYVLQLYQGSADGYYFGSSSQIGQHLTYLDMRYCNSCTQSTFPTSTLSNFHYGYPDLWYYTKNNVTPAPTYNISEPFSVNLGVDSSYCGSTILNAGNPGSTYTWNTSDISQTINVVSSGNYYVTVVNALNCIASDSIDIIINPNPIINLGNDSSYCNNVILDAGAGYTYLWNNLSTGQTLNVTTTNQYSVIVSDTNNCSGTDTISITIFNLPTVIGIATPNTVCSGDTINFQGSGATSYAWSGGVINGLNPVTIGGNYIITGTDVNNCSNSDTVLITVNPLPTVNFNFTVDSICSSSGILPLSGGSPSGGNYSGLGVSSNTFNPSIGAGSYVITYTYTDSNGCENTDTENMIVSACLGLDENIFGEITLFPNPTDGIVNVYIEKFDENYEVNVYDMLGKKIMTTQLQDNKSIIYLDVIAGVYIIEIRNKTQIVRKQITVQ